MKIYITIMVASSMAMILAGCGSSAPPMPIADVTNYVARQQVLDLPNQGNLAFAGSDIFVGVGSYGVAAESIVRIDNQGNPSTVVTGLNSIGGIIFDQTSGSLFFTDNAGDLPGTTTGDTVYELPRALQAAPTAAAELEILPTGSIPFAAQLTLQDSETLLITESAGPGFGVVLSVDLPSRSREVLIDGLDYAAGISQLANGDLLVGNVNENYLGEILAYSADGTPGGTFANLSGASDQALTKTGKLLVVGGNTPDYSSSVVVSVDATGEATTIAWGFEFSLGIDIDPISGQVGVGDSCYPDPCQTLTLLVPTNQMTGLGNDSEDCRAAFWGGTPKNPQSDIWVCQDGDLECDRDREVNGVCSFLVGACLGLDGPDDSDCVSTPIYEALLNGSASRPSNASPSLEASLANLQARVDLILPTNGPSCSSGSLFSVSTGRLTSIELQADAAYSVDTDRLQLRCR